MEWYWIVSLILVLLYIIYYYYNIISLYYIKQRLLKVIKLKKGKDKEYNDISLDSTSLKLLTSKKNIFIIINPIGGYKNGILIFKTIILPILNNLYNINYYITTSSISILPILLQLNISDCNNGLLIYGGDGFLHKIINGLKNRDDYIEFFENVPILILPGGTGNGFATSIGIKSLEVALSNFILNKYEIIKADVMEVTKIMPIPELPSNEVAEFRSVNDSDFICWGILSVSWGAIAEHDLYAEKILRSLPTILRLILAPIIVFGKNSSYFCQLKINGKIKNIAKLFAVTVMNVTHLASDVLASPASNFSDGFAELFTFNDASIFTHILDFLTVHKHPVEKITTLELNGESNSTDIVVDGELYSSKNIKLEILNSKIKLFVVAGAMQQNVDKKEN